MKTPLETARRWVAQAEQSLAMAHTLLDNGHWAGACFQAEQTAQLALKSFLFSKGSRYVNIHSVRELAVRCSEVDSDFGPIEGYGMGLDRYYLATRYPDALPAPAFPFESFSAEESHLAVGHANEIVALVRSKIPAVSQDSP